MSANLVANVTVTGNILVQGLSTNVQTLNAVSLSNVFTTRTGNPIGNQQSLIASSFHTAVVLANGTVRTFGYNLYGQLGVNDAVTRSKL